MGRKSNTKKIARKIVEEESKELDKKALFKKKTKKDIKKEAGKKAKKLSGEGSTKQKSVKKEDTKGDGKKQKSQKGEGEIKSSKKQEKKSLEIKKNAKELLQKHKKRIFAGLFAVIMIAILVSVGFLLFQKAFKPQPIAKYLPEKNTVATLEVNINKADHQIKKTADLLGNYPEYSEETVKNYIKSVFKLDYERDLSLWTGRSAGVAVMNFEGNDNTTTIGFAEFISKTNLDAFLEKYSPERDEHNGYPLAKIKIDGEVFHLTTIADYLFVSMDGVTIKKIIDSRLNKEPSLYNSARYRRIDNNIPINKVAYLYINYEAVTDSFFKHFPFFGEQGISMDNMKALMGLFKAEGIALIARDKNFTIQSFLSLRDSVADEKVTYLSSQKKYKGELLSYIPEEVILFWGGENLNSQTQKFINILAGGDPSSMKIFSKIIQSYVGKYIGGNMNFEEDIVPIINNEYVFAMEEIGEEYAYKFILSLADDNSSAVKIHEIAGSFAETGAVFEPKVVEHILQDGTVSREIMAIPREIVKSELGYEGHTIFQLNMGEEGKNIFYSIEGRLAFITNNEKSIKKSLDLFRGEGTSFAQTEEFADQVDPIIKNSEEVAYIKTQKILPMFLGEYNLPQITKTIYSLSSGRNYFYDGIVTINYLHIK